MISLETFQLWILSQAIVTALCWRYLGFGGLVGSLVGSFIYLVLR